MGANQKAVASKLGSFAESASKVTKRKHFAQAMHLFQHEDRGLWLTPTLVFLLV